MVSSTIEFATTICFLAASRVSYRPASRVASQPMRIPGVPQAFERLETPMTRSDQGRTRRGRRPERQISIGLFEEQARRRMALDELDDGPKVGLGNDRAGRVARCGERDEAGPIGHRCVAFARVRT